jgi:cytochrome c peroxidase
MHPRFKFVPALVSCLALGATATAQRTLQAGIQGEPPDVSNWPHPAAPDGNPFVRSTASSADIAQRDMVAQLGKSLFWDEQVSVDNTMACGTCHMPRAGGTDDRPGAVAPNSAFGAFGMVPQAVSQFGTVDYGFLTNPSTQIDRSVTPVTPPTMIGAYLFHHLFWDERAGPAFRDAFGVPLPNFPDWAALEDLSVEPPLSHIEMGYEDLDWQSGFLQAKLNDSFPLAMVDPSTIPPDVQWIHTFGSTYHKVFDFVFQNHPEPLLASANGVTRERFAAALANYQRTLIPDQAPIDLGQMTPDQVRGFQIMERSDCFRCHSSSGSPDIQGTGPLLDPFDNAFSDGFSHDIDIAGVRRKTATLRNVGLHTKWTSTGHGGDGVNRVFVTSQSDLLDFYEQQPPPLGTGPLTPGERAALAAFLFDALTDPRVANEQFPFDRPQLYSELHPFEGNEYGWGTAAPGGTLIPEIIANSPPQILPGGGPSWFKIGVGNAPANAPAWLLVDPAPAFAPPLFVNGPAIVLPANPTNNQGIGTIQQPVALHPALLGVPFYAQWAILDGRYGRAFSDAAEFFPFHW